MEELRILDLKLKNALPDFDESDGYSLARKNLMIEERRMMLKEAHDLVESSRNRKYEYVQRLENLYRMKQQYTEKTRNELLNEKISLLEKLVL
jgi:hypothetical protein